MQLLKMYETFADCNVVLVLNISKIPYNTYNNVITMFVSNFDIIFIMIQKSLIKSIIMIFCKHGLYNILTYV